MPEISSQNIIPIVNVKVDNTANNTAGFSRALTNKEHTAETEAQIRFTNPDMFSSETAQKNKSQIQSPLENSLKNQTTLQMLPSKMADELMLIQQKVDKNKQIFIDISDKLAAIYGEKEKDVKDKLSDVFKKLVLRPFNLVSEIDTSMGQKEHNKEKKLKDREPEKQSHKVIEAQKKFSFKQWINYKLLEIAGEILNLKRKFAAGIKRKNNNIKRAVYKMFKNLKGQIVSTLNRIDSLLESDSKK